MKTTASFVLEGRMPGMFLKYVRREVFNAANSLWRHCSVLKEQHSALVSPLRISVSASAQVQDQRRPCRETLSHEKQSSASLNLRWKVYQNVSFFRIKESLLDIKRFTTLVFWNTPTYPALGQWSIKWSGILVPSDAPYPRREGGKNPQTVHHLPQAAIQEGDCYI